MNKNHKDYVAIIVPMIKMKLCKDKYVESIKRGQNVCVSRENREQKDANMGVHQ